MSNWCARNRVVLLSLLAIVLLLGAFEGTFARTFLAADANSYLDVARQMRAGHWKTALNPCWGFGYPLLLAGWLSLFPSGLLDEWIGVHLLNLLILVATYFSFYSVVAAGFMLVKDGDDVQSQRVFRWLILFAFPVFITTELYFDEVSRVGPDMLVSCIIFTVVARLLRLNRDVRARDPFLFGCLLGAGYLVKGIFLPLAILCLMVELVILWRKPGGLRHCLISAVSFAVLAVPYAAGMSWSFGHPTLGEVGPLNYAWRVNHLQGDAFWQGGPPGFGNPEHPAQQAMSDPRVFLFHSPAGVTYGPWYDPPAYYYGYRHFFNLQNQVHATLANIVTLFKLLRAQPVLYLLLFAIFVRRNSWRRCFRASLHLWPMLLVGFAGFGAYLTILIYPRYIASFVSLVFLFLCLSIFAGDSALFAAEFAVPSRIAIFALMLIACILDPIARPREPLLDPVAHLRHHQFFWNDPEWLTARYLAHSGVQPGEHVAVIKSDFFTGWAYLDHLHIVGQVGGEWLEPRIDETGIFWRSKPDKQLQILNALHNGGAELVVGFEKPSDVKLEGWENVPRTNVWIYRFNPNEYMAKRGG